MKRAAATLSVSAMFALALSAAGARAEVTPIEPSPRDPSRPAFQLYAEFDLPALGIGVVFAGARLVRTQKAWCAPRCDEKDLNAFDRLTAGRWDPAWTNVSNIGIAAVIAAPAIYLLADEGPLNALNDAVVIGEAALLASATSTIMTVAAGRPRPFLYGDKAPLEDRNTVDASMSFISSHTAISFAVATSTWMTYRRLHPRSRAHWLVLAVGDAAATLVGTARMLAGRHFPTDVLSGAIVGTSVGVMVPALHGAPVQVVPTAGKDHAGLAVTGFF
ncbi:MAG: phosphatase PAP2 family protein [Deltaproteobacteria bacterium]|nr:phosphatase PAP2 family protein [Deltaproteobacteria bacterium]